jgi:hypothetical protein
MQGSDSVHRLSRRRLGTPSGLSAGVSAKPTTDLICANKALVDKSSGVSPLDTASHAEEHPTYELSGSLAAWLC